MSKLPPFTINCNQVAHTGTIKIQGELHRGSPHAAGYDLMATKRYLIHPGRRQLVATGVRLEMPPHMAALVLSRSGLALKQGVIVLNAPGLIDPDYRGEVGVILYNTHEQAVEINPGDRVAQLMFTPFVAVQQEVSDEFSATLRGTGGFGSTGV